MPSATLVADRPSPPELLREMLTEDRRLGLDFDSVFDEDCSLAARHSRSWLKALLGTRESWRRFFWDEAGGTRLSLDLLDDSGDRVRGAGELVA
jgi:hypothetical protein